MIAALSLLGHSCGKSIAKSGARHWLRLEGDEKVMTRVRVVYYVDSSYCLRSYLTNKSDTTNQTRTADFSVTATGLYVEAEAWEAARIGVGSHASTAFTC